MPSTFSFLLIFLLSLLLTVVGLRFLLPFLKRRHVGQKILEIGPAWHRPKEGTPTMGGIAFIAAAIPSVIVGCLLLAADRPPLFLRALILTFLYALCNAAVGCVDDLTKFRKEQNEGLTPRQKLVLQVTFAAAYLFLMRLYGYLDTSVYLPFLNRVWDLGYFYYFCAMILAVGAVNCVNLSDGVDGLAATLSLLVSGFFAYAAVIADDGGTLLFAASTMGGCLGFLFYNFHPAKIFMGDTGSLFLGAVLVGCAFSIGNPLILLLCGAVFIFEGVSVVLQVLVFKLTHRRLFRMAPFHHHLEKCGWSEIRIVATLGGATLLCCVLAALGLA